MLPIFSPVKSGYSAFASASVSTGHSQFWKSIENGGNFLTGAKNLQAIERRGKWATSREQKGKLLLTTGQ